MWLLFGTNNEHVSTFFRSCVFLFPLDTATFIPKRELSSFTPEEIKQSLHKERDNLISTGTLEAIPKNEWNSIPKNKQITSHTFTEVKRQALLDSGAELTITNDLSLFYSDTLEYLTDNFNYFITRVFFSFFEGV